MPGKWTTNDWTRCALVVLMVAVGVAMTIALLSQVGPFAPPVLRSPERIAEPARPRQPTSAPKVTPMALSQEATRPTRFPRCPANLRPLVVMEHGETIFSIESDGSIVTRGKVVAKDQRLADVLGGALSSPNWKPPPGVDWHETALYVAAN